MLTTYARAGMGGFKTPASPFDIVFVPAGINDSHQVVFMGQLAAGGHGLYLGNANGSLTPIAATGSQSAGAPSTAGLGTRKAGRHRSGWPRA